MQVFHKLDDIPRDFGPALVSVGNFDGVHRAHRNVIGEIVWRAQATHVRSVVVTFGTLAAAPRAHGSFSVEMGWRAKATHVRSVVVTFEPHPARILRPEQNLTLLTPLPEKLRLLEATGIDAVVLLPFSRDLSLMTPHQFVHEILKKRLHAREVHEGYNFHFGRKAAGNIELLREFGREMGFDVHDYSEMRLRGENVSSSHIRKLLS